jgi:hypothetical protein
MSEYPPSCFRGEAPTRTPSEEVTARAVQSDKNYERLSFLKQQTIESRPNASSELAPKQIQDILKFTKIGMRKEVYSYLEATAQHLTWNPSLLEKYREGYRGDNRNGNATLFAHKIQPLKDYVKHLEYLCQPYQQQSIVIEAKVALNTINSIFNS